MESVDEQSLSSEIERDLNEVIDHALLIRNFFSHAGLFVYVAI